MHKQTWIGRFLEEWQEQFSSTSLEIMNLLKCILVRQGSSMIPLTGI